MRFVSDSCRQVKKSIKKNMVKSYKYYSEEVMKQYWLYFVNSIVYGIFFIEGKIYLVYK